MAKLIDITDATKSFISEDPLVYTINNFITNDECEHMIEISKDKIEPALVSGEKEGFISNGRTGKNCWIKHDHDNITLNIAKKIANEVNIPLVNAESFQVIYYDKTQEYKQHYDGWLFDGSEKSKRNMKAGGQRMLTSLVYLNNVEQGGGTKFTKIDKEVNAEKGKLLIFSNVHKGTNKRHELSEHAGMPVLEGEKWAFNLWFREQDRSIEYVYEDISKNEKNNQKSTKINYKKSMNEEWRKWVKNKLESKTNINLIKINLLKQNYCPQLIHEVIYANLNLLKNSYIDQFPEQFLELGDYFPFIKLGTKELYNIVDSKYIVLINIFELNQEVINNVEKLNSEYYHVFVLYSSRLNTLQNKSNYISIQTIPNILDTSKETIYILNANRRIINIQNIDNNDTILNINDLQLEDSLNVKLNINLNTNINIKYLLIENVLDDSLLKKILNYYDNNSEKRELHNTPAKNRLHVHPDLELEKMIDNKLSRSLFPEIKKIFYFNVEYREIYKICSYDSETNGRFAAHRDTPYPHQHRKFALSLILNDDHEGGELFLPEYDRKIKPKANSAIVFPGICSHQVMPITCGSRKTIITFFCTEKPNEHASNDRNKLKSNFFKERKVENSLVYPF